MSKLSISLLKTSKRLVKSRFSGLFLLVGFMTIAYLVIQITGGASYFVINKLKVSENNYAVANTDLEPFYVDQTTSNTTTTTSQIQENTTTTDDTSGEVKAASTSDLDLFCKGEATAKDITGNFQPVCEAKGDADLDLEDADCGLVTGSASNCLPQWTYSVKLNKVPWNPFMYKNFNPVPTVANEVSNVYNDTANAAINMRATTYTLSPADAKLIKKVAAGLKLNVIKYVTEIKSAQADVLMELTGHDVFAKNAPLVDKVSENQRALNPAELNVSAKLTPIGSPNEGIREKELDVPGCTSLIGDPNIRIHPVNDSEYTLFAAGVPGLIDNITGRIRTINSFEDCQCKADGYSCISGITDKDEYKNEKKRIDAVNCSGAKALAGIILSDPAGSPSSCSEDSCANGVAAYNLNTMLSPGQVSDMTPNSYKGKVKVGNPMYLTSTPCELLVNDYIIVSTTCYFDNWSTTGANYTNWALTLRPGGIPDEDTYYNNVVKSQEKARLASKGVCSNI